MDSESIGIQARMSSSLPTAFIPIFFAEDDVSGGLNANPENGDHAFHGHSGIAAHVQTTF